MPKGLRKASEGEQLINGITMVFAQATTDAVVASAALEPSVSLVGYLALFVGIGLVFVFVNLLVGRFLRPHNPHQEKGESMKPYNIGAGTAIRLGLPSTLPSEYANSRILTGLGATPLITPDQEEF